MHLIYMTAPDAATATTIARALVDERLAACCNIISGVRSVYRWEGAVEESDEVLVIIKSTPEMFDKLRDRVQQLHPYDVPELIAHPITHGSEPYIKWVFESVRSDGG
jgi:periplasmic divalent cation tolerance protein